MIFSDENPTLIAEMDGFYCSVLFLAGFMDEIVHPAADFEMRLRSERITARARARVKYGRLRGAARARVRLGLNRSMRRELHSVKQWYFHGDRVSAWMLELRERHLEHGDFVLHPGRCFC